MTELTNEYLGAVTRLLQKSLESRGRESAPRARWGMGTFGWMPDLRVVCPAGAVGDEGERESQHGFAELSRRLYDAYMECME